MRMEYGIGDFVCEHAPLVSLLSGKVPNDRAIDALNSLYEVGSYRTIEQDVAFGIRQIVDIALKALSPGINDTTTAVTCADYLGAILVETTRRKMRAQVHRAREGACVVAREATFAELMAEALDQIRENAKGNPAVMAALAHAIAVCAGQTQSSVRREVLREQLRLLEEIAERTLPSEYERAKIRAQVEHTRTRLELATCAPNE